MPVAHVNGVDIYFEVAGAGPRLLALPGSGADLRNANIGRPLEDRFTVLTLDQRGLGQSGVPAGPYSMADYVLGISFGGMVAQEIAIRAPQRVDRLVLACSSSGGAGGASAPLHEYADLPLDEQTAVRMEVLDRRHDAEWRTSHPDEVAAFRDRLARAAARDDEAKRGGRLQLLARAGHDTFDRLLQITAPTLVAGGRFDGQAPPANQAAIHARIEGSQLDFFEGGHGFTREDPRAYEAFAAFLLGEGAST